MTISTSYDYSTTRDSIIKGALRILGVLPTGATPSAAQVTDASEALNQIIKAWGAESAPIWTIKKQTIPLTNAVNMYAIGSGQTVNIPKPLKIYQALLHDTTDEIDIPLIGKSQEEYQRLSQKESSGQPVHYYFENLRDFGNLYVYPTPDSTTAADKTIQIIYQAPLADFDTASDEPDVPQEGIRALKWVLASELCMEYGVPENRIKVIMTNAELRKIEFFNSIYENTSLFFKVDTSHG